MDSKDLSLFNYNVLQILNKIYNNKFTTSLITPNVYFIMLDASRIYGYYKNEKKERLYFSEIFRDASFAPKPTDMEETTERIVKSIQNLKVGTNDISVAVKTRMYNTFKVIEDHFHKQLKQKDDTIDTMKKELKIMKSATNSVNQLLKEHNVKRQVKSQSLGEMVKWFVLKDRLTKYSSADVMQLLPSPFNNIEIFDILVTLTKIDKNLDKAFRILMNGYEFSKTCLSSIDNKHIESLNQKYIQLTEEINRLDSISKGKLISEYEHNAQINLLKYEYEALCKDRENKLKDEFDQIVIKLRTELDEKNKQIERQNENVNKLMQEALSFKHDREQEIYQLKNELEHKNVINVQLNAELEEKNKKINQLTDENNRLIQDAHTLKIDTKQRATEYIDQLNAQIERGNNVVEKIKNEVEKTYNFTKTIKRIREILQITTNLDYTCIMISKNYIGLDLEKFEQLDTIDQIVYITFKYLNNTALESHNHILKELNNIYKQSESPDFQLIQHSESEINKSLSETIIDEIKTFYGDSSGLLIAIDQSGKEQFAKTMFLLHYIGPFENVKMISEYLAANKKLNFILQDDAPVHIHSKSTMSIAKGVE